MIIAKSVQREGLSRQVLNLAVDSSPIGSLGGEYDLSVQMAG